MLNLYYIFASFIWNTIDYLHLKEIARSVIYTPSTKISSQFSPNRNLPSANSISAEEYSEEVVEYRNKNSAIKASERKIKEILLTRSKKGPRK